VADRRRLGEFNLALPIIRTSGGDDDLSTRPGGPGLRPPVCRDRLLNLTKQRRQLRIACSPRVREARAMLARAVGREFCASTGSLRKVASTSSLGF